MNEEQLKTLLDSVEVIAGRMFVQNWSPGMQDVEEMAIECIDSAIDFVDSFSAFRSKMIKENAKTKEVSE